MDNTHAHFHKSCIAFVLCTAVHDSAHVWHDSFQLMVCACLVLSPT